MNCDDVRNGIYVFLDGEFASPEEAEFQRHLDGCDGCRVRVEEEARFLNLVKDNVEEQEVPPGLEARVRASLESRAAQGRPVGWFGGESPTQWWRLGWVGVPVAASLGVVLFLVLPPTPASSESELGRAARHAVTTHHSRLPVDVSGNEDTVERFIEKNVSFAASTPFARSQELQLVGARLTHVDGQPAVVYQYRLGARRISVLQRPRRQRDVRRHREVKHMLGYGVVSFSDRGVTHTVVGALPDRDLMRLLPVRAHR